MAETPILLTPVTVIIMAPVLGIGYYQYSSITGSLYTGRFESAVIDTATLLTLSVVPLTSCLFTCISGCTYIVLHGMYFNNYVCIVCVWLLPVVWYV